jgi:N-acetylated-alpha-linked acidic dipeptidase
MTAAAWGALGAAWSLVVAGAATTDTGPAALTGYGAAHAAEQLALEQRFDAAIAADDQRDWVRRMAAAPNQVGSPHDRANADFVLQQLRAWGWDARIETFEVLYPTPRELELELLAPRHVRAALREPPIPGDRTSAATRGALPPYNAYGGDGDVQAELVYVNYGMPDDYEELARHGIPVEGRIVIARYGGGWRGLKPKLAQEHGAVGCLIYSDPRDDGYAVDDAYPKGGSRPATGVQRGSVVDMPIYAGDPETPGTASTPGAPRLARSEVKTILRIPVLPISYGDAEPLLAALGGDVVPPAWRGALGLTYHFGPGPARVHLKVKSDWGHKTIYDVIGTIRGSEHPDSWVIRGNHRDGWVFGAWDPLAGHAAMLSEARAIGELLRSGWRPRRTLVYASWDAEEPGLLGSTEWAEAHAAELAAKAVAYVNSDSNERGFLDAGGSHALQHMVNEVAAAVADPETSVSVRERLRARQRADGYAKSASEEVRRLTQVAASGGDLEIEPLGSGSDYTPFLQHLGVSVLNFGFGGEGEQRGVYHSVYDSYDHYERFGDPGYAYGVALARMAGHTVLRLADADVPPFRYTDLADTIARYVDELRRLADGMRARSAERNALIAADAFRLAADPRHTYVAPPPEDTVPYFDFAALANAQVRLKESARRADAALARLAAAGGAADPAARAALERATVTLEQTLLAGAGLPGRPWYRHTIYAPGLLTGYGVKTLPGVREAIEQRRWAEAAEYIGITAAALERCSAQLERIAAIQ